MSAARRSTFSEENPQHRPIGSPVPRADGLISSSVFAKMLPFRRY